MSAAAIEIFDDIEQGTPEWYKLRLGLPTASCFSDILAKGQGKMRKTYMMKLAGEIVTGDPTEPYTNKFLERGKEMEPDARRYYAMMEGVDLRRVGFIKRGVAGCSPDALIGDDGMLELKTAMPHILSEIIINDQFPPEHVAQCQGNLWVAQREWIDLCIYWPKFPPFIKRAYRDDIYITTLASEVDRFHEELQNAVYKIKNYGKAAAA